MFHHTFLTDIDNLEARRRSDLMSYVAPTAIGGTPNWDADDPEKGFTPNQIRLLQVYVNAPWMGAYRYFRLAVD